MKNDVIELKAQMDAKCKLQAKREMDNLRAKMEAKAEVAELKAQMESKCVAAGLPPRLIQPDATEYKSRGAVTRFKVGGNTATYAEFRQALSNAGIKTDDVEKRIITNQGRREKLTCRDAVTLDALNS